ncbi:MAG: cupin domain-containing protein [Opitutales bacterium]|nr:cupin domain-containing protein [Opitutales bacterium]
MMIPKIEIAKNVAGGNGDTVKKHLLTADELNDKTRMFAEITLKPGCSIGYHEHHGESETYYILSGTGTYNDNGEIRSVAPGDVTFTPSGQGHGLENTGPENLVFIALILRD